MVAITYIEFDGRDYEVEVEEGINLMQAALDNLVDGIVAECGGCCVCSTCHCIIDPAWASKIPAPNEEEAEVLEMVSERQATSRLSCQIQVTANLNGLIVRLPKSQY